MNAVSTSILTVLVAAVCFGPRRWALLGVMAGVFLLTQGHSIDIFGLKIFPIRVLEVVAFARVLGRGELSLRQLNRIDVLLLLVYNYSALVWILRSPSPAPSQYASALDPTLCYLALRGLVDDVEDLRWFLTTFVALLVLFTALVIVESWTRESAFTIVGAAPLLMFRDGIARCQGAFRQPILMGSVAASFIPLYVGTWMEGRARLAAGVGLLLCLGLVWLSHSGGPVTSVAAACLGWCLWPLRRRLSLIRRIALALVVMLLLCMRAPIWYLPFKISSIVGGGGYHRSVLMEHAWQDLGKWWAAGMDIKETASWTPYVLDAAGGGVDITNQLLVFGIKAGLLALALAIAMMVLAFIRAGNAMALLRCAAVPPERAEFLLWALGVTMFVHLVTWFGVSYFDQSYVVWLMELAALSSVTESASLAAVQESAPAATQRQRRRIEEAASPSRFAAQSRGPFNPRFRAPVRMR